MRLREYGVHADNAHMRMRMKISSTFIRIQDHKFTNESNVFSKLVHFISTPCCRYGPSGSGELKIEAKNGSKMG